MITIRAETIDDQSAVRSLNELAFGQPDEAKLVDALRKSVSIYISLVAVKDGEIVGHILFTPVTIESDVSSFTALGLGPMAVHPAHQRQGIGSELVRHGLEECRRIGHSIIVLVGHPEYYPRFGFVPGKLRDLTCEFEVPDEAFMVLELETGALLGRSGLVKYHPEFSKF
jgi:putative acetyltransferase